jgi:colanic acid biosynthesis protein WcaH
MDVHDEFVPEGAFADALRRFPQACVEVVFTDDRGVLLARRTNEPAAGEYFWPGSRLYKGERLTAAAGRVAREELGVDVEVGERLGVYEHFWDTASVAGVDSRHTINLVYRVRPTGDAEVTLDDQHDDYRFVTGPEPWMHDYVREYVVDGVVPADLRG